MKKIELLAPAGNLIALKAAVENGADAVYIGGELFSARQNAGNFTAIDMAQGVEYAHKRGCKIYVAVNTLLHNEEIGDLIAYAYELAELKVDAVIVQDLGVMRLLQETLPQLEVHASTQMAVHNAAGVKFLAEQGIKRVVLARETSLEEIKKIRQQTDVELEVFVHGALCVGYSGQCLLSSLIGGRSGNRGLCAQPCRMAYQLVNSQGEAMVADGKYLLSTRDLNMIEHLPELIRAGVNSLKIEGRMKRPEYVATVVKHYRQAIDCYYAHIQPNLTKANQELLQIFNRKFTSGYFFGNQGADLMQHKKPDNGGVFAGKIVKTKGKRVSVLLEKNINQGDGYALSGGKNKEVAGKILDLQVKGKAVEHAVKGQTIEFTAAEEVKDATVMYCTSDVILLKQAQDSYKTPSQPLKQQVHFKIELRQGKPISLLAWDTEGNQAYSESAYLVETARTQPSTEESIRKQLERLGNTGYVLGDLIVEMDEGVIAPASELNQIRREVMDKLEQQENEAEELPAYDDYIEDVGDFLDRIPPAVFGYTEPQISVHVGTKESAEAALAAGAQCIILNATALRGQKVMTKEDYQFLAKTAHEQGAEIYWTCAPVVKEDQGERMQALMRDAKDCGFDGVVVGNLGLLQMAREMGWENIAADYQMNVLNDLTVQTLSGWELSKITLSPELSLKEIEDCSYRGNLPLELIVHGNFPLMLSEQCVAGSVCGGRTAETSCQAPCGRERFALKDRMGMQFPLKMDEYCRMYIYNCKTLSLYKRLDAVLPLGIDYLRIEGREQEPEWITATVNSYRQALEQYQKHGKVIVDLHALQLLENNAPQGSTYGHYFRGV